MNGTAAILNPKANDRYHERRHQQRVQRGRTEPSLRQSF